MRLIITGEQNSQVTSKGGRSVRLAWTMRRSGESHQKHFQASPIASFGSGWLLCNSKLKEIEAAGQKVVILYAQCIVQDSMGRYQPGDWLHTSWSNSFEDRFF